MRALNLLRRLLLVPLLAPLLAVLITGGLNPGPSLRLRLLTWQTPALALGQSNGPALRRRLHRDGGFEGFRDDGELDGRRWPDPAEQRQRAPMPRQEQRDSWSWQADAFDAGPSRSPGEPAPTVSVPYRVIRRGGDDRIDGQTTATRMEARRRQAVAEPVPVEDDWSDSRLEDW